MNDEPLNKKELIAAIAGILPDLSTEQLQLTLGYVEGGLKWQSDFSPEIERRGTAGKAIVQLEIEVGRKGLELERARREIADLKADRDDTYRQLDEALNSGDGTYKP